MAETKLLHTLHWMLLEAAQECQQEAGLGHGWSGSGSSAFLQPLGNQGSPGSAPRCSGSLDEDEHARAKLFHKSMATVELFVFLFAPLVNRIKVPPPCPAPGDRLVLICVDGAEWSRGREIDLAPTSPTNWQCQIPV